LAIETFKIAAKLNVLSVPYKESGTAITDLVGGRINAYFSGPPAILPLVKAEKMRPLAVTSQTRLTALPETPTTKEAGYAGFDTTSWFGFATPANTPDNVVMKLNMALKSALATPGIKEKFEAQGMQMTSSTPQEMTRMIAREYAATGKVVKEASMKVD
jgi:tripartite-type tricarboxylate transporter receptor subunit TctC